MNTLRKNEWIAVSVALVAVIILFFGGSIWNFIFGDSSASNSSLSVGEESPTKVQEKMANISEIAGLEIYDMKIGTGIEAAKGMKVKAHYVGVLTDGTQFDSSLQRGVPYEFVLGTGAVIKGWDLGIVGMKVGGVRQLIVSPELAYGPQAIGPIPANSTLIFQIELVDAQ